ncbi:MAG: DUF3187 family protein [Thermodesulfobacteriota bacterium]
MNFSLLFVIVALMKRSLPAIGLFAVLWLIRSSLPGSLCAGPLEIKNQFPLSLHLNTPYPESAEIRDTFRVQLFYSSIFFMRENPTWSIRMDFETTELVFSLRKCLSDSLEAGLDLPFLSFNSGFMDRGLEWYHTTFGFANYGRSSRPANQFLYRIRKNQDLLLEGEQGGAGLGDLRISGKKVLWKHKNQPLLSLKTSLELPTGDPNKGYGNGGVDWGISVQLEKKLGRLLQANLNLGLVAPGDLKTSPLIDLRTYYYGCIGVEAEATPAFSLLGQFSVQTSPFPTTGIKRMDNPALMFSLGARYQLGRTFWECALTEDLNGSGAPDFIFGFSFKQKF